MAVYTTAVGYQLSAISLPLSRLSDTVDGGAATRRRRMHRLRDADGKMASRESSVVSREPIADNPPHVYSRDAAAGVRRETPRWDPTVSLLW